MYLTWHVGPPAVSLRHVVSSWDRLEVGLHVQATHDRTTEWYDMINLVGDACLTGELCGTPIDRIDCTVRRPGRPRLLQPEPFDAFNGLSGCIATDSLAMVLIDLVRSRPVSTAPNTLVLRRARLAARLHRPIKNTVRLTPHIERISR